MVMIAAARVEVLMKDVELRAVAARQRGESR